MNEPQYDDILEMGVTPEQVRIYTDLYHRPLKGIPTALNGMVKSWAVRQW